MTIIVLDWQEKKKFTYALLPSQYTHNTQIADFALIYIYATCIIFLHYGP